MTVILIAFFVIPGFLLVGLSLFFFVRLRSIRAWTRCSGMVQEIIAEESVVTEGSSTLNAHLVYGLRYAYTVDGTTHSGTSSIKSSLNGKYRVGDAMTIAYNPHSHSESDQYEPYYGFIHLFLFIPGVLMLVVGIVVLCQGS